MGTSGFFGFILKRRRYMMYVQHDADSLWSRLRKELNILLRHHGGDVVALRKAFKKLTILTDDTPVTADMIAACKRTLRTKVDDMTFNPFRGVFENRTSISTYQLVRGCQNSWLMVFDCGYFLNDANMNTGQFGFMIDFDTNDPKCAMMNFYAIGGADGPDLINSAMLSSVLTDPRMPNSVNYTDLKQKIIALHEDYEKELILAKGIKAYLDYVTEKYPDSITNVYDQLFRDKTTLTGINALNTLCPHVDKLGFDFYLTELIYTHIYPPATDETADETAST